mgnify:CR=1 FL=1
MSKSRADIGREEMQTNPIFILLREQITDIDTWRWEPVEDVHDYVFDTYEYSLTPRTDDEEGDIDFDRCKSFDDLVKMGEAQRIFANPAGVFATREEAEQWCEDHKHHGYTQHGKTHLIYCVSAIGKLASWLKEMEHIETLAQGV